MHHSRRGGQDVICGLGDDGLRGGDGRDTLTGSTGTDRLFGEAGNDILDARDRLGDNDVANGGTDACSADASDGRLSGP